MKERGWQYTAALVLVTMGIVIGGCIAEVLGKISDYSIMWDPPHAADVIWCCVYGLVAVAAALKLDIPLVGQLAKGDILSAVARLKGTGVE